MPKTKRRKPRKAASAPVPAASANKFVWNWRMLMLGVLLNVATLSLVLYTVSLLHDYRQYTEAVTAVTPAKQRSTTPSAVDANTNQSAPVNAAAE